MSSTSTELADTNSCIQNKIKKIAVILPVAYGGGSLRGACLLAQSLLRGSELFNEAVEISFVHLKHSLYDEEFRASLNPAISTRTYSWKFLDAESAKKAMHFVGQVKWEPEEELYAVMDDEMHYLADCDLWLIISDRLQAPLLPIRPYILMVYDYIQRYVPEVCLDDKVLLKVARLANAVWTTTNHTYRDALQYAGLAPQKVKQVPMLVPNFQLGAINSRNDKKYFIWTTNLGAHKNHLNSFIALKYYYDELEGALDCFITGVNTDRLFESEQIKGLVEDSEMLQNKVRLFGNVSDEYYADILRDAAFLWHTAKIDNGTFSVIEAYQLGIPSLSSNYPAMREINEKFLLNLAWMDAHNPINMALQLKWMEGNYCKCSFTKQTQQKIIAHYFENQAAEYWKVVRECL